VGYAARLASPIRADERIRADIHLIHGELDSIVPVVHARQALRGLQAAGANVTLDINADGTHTIGQEGVILGTTRVLQTIFRGRLRPTRHSAGHPLH
jgi:dipeptidyl aminopeptidase/acylaminoacyl peptidase